MSLDYEEMMKAKEFLPFKIGYLNEELREKAKEELNETEETRGKGIEELRNLILAEKKLKCPTDDDYLLLYLRARKFDVKKAFKLLCAYFQVKKDYPECFDSVDYEKLDIVAKGGSGCFLPYRSPDGCAILLLEFSKWDNTKSSIVDILRILAILVQYAGEDPATQVCGIRILVNVQGVTFSRIRSLSPRYIYLLARALKNCIPCRFKGIHIFNESSLFQPVWSVLKLFLSEKINKRVYFHSDNQKQLHKFIPKELLTADYGGNNLYFDQGEWCSKMMIDFRTKIEIIMSSGFDK